MNQTNQSIAMRVSAVTLAGNVLLSGAKLFAGIFGRSSAMISDAVHSISDVMSTVIVMIGVKAAGKASDEKHPYGHERFECVAALLLSIMLFATGLGIGYAGFVKIISGNYGSFSMPGLIALIMAVVSCIGKEAMYWYTRRAAKQINSGALMADAWHHRSDALSSIGSFVGILGARMGLPILDSIASLVICAFILKAAIGIFLDCIRKMTDNACDEATIRQIESITHAQDGVLGIDGLKTRLFGDKIYVDIEICADGDGTLNAAHKTAHLVHDAIESGIPNIKHCMVHVNPAPCIAHEIDA